jgi:hypothetical protein
MAKEETVLECMIDRLNKIRRLYRMEKNVGKTEARRISREP